MSTVGISEIAVKVSFLVLALLLWDLFFWLIAVLCIQFKSNMFSKRPIKVYVFYVLPIGQQVETLLK